MRYFLASVLLISLPSLAHAQAKDMIWLHSSNKMLSGEIRKVSPEAISMEIGGRTQDVSVSDIDRLRFHDDPSGLASVRASVKNGQLEEAQAQLSSIAPSGRAIVRQELAFLSAKVSASLALRGKSSVTSAARDVRNFLREHPNSFRFYEACEIMGNLAMSLGRFDSAATYYEKLIASESTDLATRGSLLLGDAYSLNGDFVNASKMYARCTKATDARLQAMGQIGAAVSQLHTSGQPQAAIASLERVIAENDSSDSELFARAYNGLGKAYLAAGQTESALDAFLHTNLLFYRDTDRHAEALYHLAKLWADVNKPTEATKAIRSLASLDPLTGLMNRRSFSASLDVELKRMSRTRHAAAVILFDLDHFKKLNDRFGHHVGDEMLTSVASIAYSELRNPFDRLARWGGEEFIILLHDMSEETARGVCERLRQRIGELELNIDDQTVKVTASFGGSLLRPDRPFSEALHQADIALYEAKSNGRNRVAFKRCIQLAA